MRRRLLIVCLTVLTLTPALAVAAQQNGLQTAPPQHRIEPPSPNATAADLEKRGDELREQKAYLDALDYYKAALAKNKTAILYNKMGIAELQLMRLGDARKDFNRATKMDKTYPEPYNNLGVVYYQQKKYGKAVKEYKKAIALRESASFYSNLGSAYFSQKHFDQAALEYNRAMQLDPEIFERNSKGGVSAQLQSPEDRAHFSFVLAKMYAQAGNFDRSLQYLRKAMEDGYSGINDVYKDQEFAKLREDPRFAQLMADKPVAIPQ